MRTFGSLLRKCWTMIRNMLPKPDMMPPMPAPAHNPMPQALDRFQDLAWNFSEGEQSIADDLIERICRLTQRDDVAWVSIGEFTASTGDPRIADILESSFPGMLLLSDSTGRALGLDQSNRVWRDTADSEREYLVVPGVDDWPSQLDVARLDPQIGELHERFLALDALQRRMVDPSSRFDPRGPAGLLQRLRGNPFPNMDSPNGRQASLESFFTHRGSNTAKAADDGGKTRNSDGEKAAG